MYGVASQEKGKLLKNVTPYLTTMVLSGLKALKSRRGELQIVKLFKAKFLRNSER